MLRNTHLFTLAAVVSILWSVVSLFLFWRTPPHTHEVENEQQKGILDESKKLLQESKKVLHKMQLILDDKEPAEIPRAPVKMQVTDCSNSSTSTHLLERPQNEIEVLLWEGVNWAGFGKNNHFLDLPNYLGHTVNKTCPIKCTYTADRSRIGTVDGVIFESSTYGFDEMETLPKNGRLKFPQKRYWQRWINFGYETPIYFPLQGHDLWKRNMDLDMTYVQTGANTVPITLTCSWGGGQLSDLLKPPPPKTATAPVVFMATNCGAGGATTRTKFVSELMKHVKIDSYGQCLHNKDLPESFQGRIYDDHGKSMRNKIEMFKPYKFVLAFENNNITDYVTEKLMCVLQAGAVPIYMGASNIDEWTPGDKSIIKVDDFRDVKHLAEHINYLDKNPDEYAKYFQWKKEGFSEQFVEKYNRCIFYGAECRLCTRLAELRKKVPRPPAEKMHSIMFDGTGSIEVKHRSELDVLSKTYSLVAWIYANSFNDYRIIDKNTPGTINGFNFDVLQSNSKTHGNLRLCAAGGCYTGKRNLYTNHWYHVAVSFSQPDGQVKLFVDGELDSSHRTDSATATNRLPLYIGSSNHSSYWDGIIDEVAIFTKSLTSETVKDLMYNQLLGDEEDLLAYWPMNEGKGRTCYDLSKNQLHGMLTGGIDFIPGEVKPVHIRPFDVSIQIAN